MKYTKPHVLQTRNASEAIQSSHNDNNKGTMIRQDSAPVVAYSTTGAYEADE